MRVRTSIGSESDSVVDKLHRIQMTSGSGAPASAPMRRPVTRPAPYVIAMALMTAAYLLFELGFNARLLDVVGGYATLDEIHAIEQWGRIISGLAVTLAVWGTWILPCAHKKRWPAGSLVVVLSVSAGVLMAGTYHGQKALIDQIVDGSDGVTRRAAAHLRAISTAVMSGSANIDGIDLSAGQADTPEGKSFLALFPFIALSTEDLEAKSIAAMRAVLRSTAESRMGTAEQAYNDAFIPSVRSIVDSYNGYVEGNRTFARVIDDIPRRQEIAWRDYEDDLKKRNRRLTPNNVPGNMRNRVGDSLRRKGLDIPRGWHPSDRQTFNAAVAKKVRTEAASAFQSELTRSLGASLPPGLEWEAFQEHPVIQRRWQRELQAGKAPLAADMGFDAYRDDVYTPKVERWIDDELTKLKQSAEEFADGGTHELVGRSALESLVVPPIALAFSLLGALVHLFKSANYVSTICVARLPRRRTIILTAIAAVAVTPFLLPNQVTDSRIFGYFEEQTAEAFSPPTAWAARWVIQAQPYFYPMNELIRMHVLGGYGFGYDPDD